MKRYTVVEMTFRQTKMYCIAFEEANRRKVVELFQGFPVVFAMNHYKDTLNNVGVIQAVGSGDEAFHQAIHERLENVTNTLVIGNIVVYTIAAMEMF